MDDTMYNALLLALFVISVLQFLKHRSRPRPPPGPRNLPVIGSAHHVVRTLVHRRLRDLAAVHGPVMLLKIGPMPLLVVTSRDLAREVLKTQDPNFANRPKLLAGDIVGYHWTDIIFAPTSDYWRKIRKLCIQEILSPKRILSFQHIREEEVQRRVDEIRAGGPSTSVDLTALFHEISNRIISRAAFGQIRHNAADFRAAIKEVIGLSSGFNVPDLFPGLTGVLSSLTGMKRQLRRIHETVDGIFEDIIEERRRVREEKMSSGLSEDEIVGENVIDVMLTLQKKGGWGFPITNSTIKGVILDMFSGGTGTSGSAMEWAMSEIMRNPGVMQKLQAEIRRAFHGKEVVTETDLHNSDLKYLKYVMKEAMRLHPPAPLLVPRESIGTCELGGYVIPGGSRVAINVWAISRDPRYWDKPEEFRPERFDGSAVDFHGTSYEFTPFGAGRRMCPGYNYGLASMELTLLLLLYHFDWALPAGVEEVDMTEAMGLGVRRKNPLVLWATPNVPPSMA